MKILLVFIICLVINSAFNFPSIAKEEEEDSQSARILAYFMVGQDENPQASVTTQQFESQIITLKNESSLLSLPKIISSWEKGTSLPSKATTITFDGGHRSILINALPILMKYKIPFTIFIAPDLANIGAPQYIGWEDIKKLQKTGLATIGMHPASYNHYTNIEDFTKDINKARAGFREKLGEIPKLFSFPFGEYNDEAIQLIKNQNFIAFGQQSGVSYKYLNSITPIPRFTMNEFHSNEARLNMIINSLPLPATDISLNPIGFTAIKANKDISCYSNNEAGIKIEKINKQRVEIRPNKPLSTKRLRINCTQKVNDNQIRWLGFLTVRN